MAASQDKSQDKCNVGGVLLDQPFKIRRLGHFGLGFLDMESNLPIYRDLLGFQIADVRDPFAETPKPEEFRDFGDTNAYFMRYGTDHHAFAFANHRLVRATDTRGAFREGVTLGQISWQVGSLAEVVDGENWLREKHCKIISTGRAGPGSNWHTYLMDPDSHRNEILYGIEQIGWDGHSRPVAMLRRTNEFPDQPVGSVHQEVDDAVAEGIDLMSGYRHVQETPAKFNAAKYDVAKYDVQGVELPRPFRIVKHGPIGLFVANMSASLDFYCGLLGFIITEKVDYRGHDCVFLRTNTEHHALALYPIALRQELGLSEHTTCAGIGMQVANYQQLRDAREFLAENGLRIGEMPPELTPGMDYNFLAFDKDGHALQFYYSMEQIGWDGRPRPAEARRRVEPGEWPASLPALPDTYMGETFPGPWA